MRTVVGVGLSPATSEVETLKVVMAAWETSGGAGGSCRAKIGSAGLSSSEDGLLKMPSGNRGALFKMEAALAATAIEGGDNSCCWAGSAHGPAGAEPEFLPGN